MGDHTRLPPFPEAISHFINFAPSFTRGGAMNSLTLVKRPPKNIGAQEGGAAIIAAWDEWWESTTWAKDPGNARWNPRWQSHLRKGAIWTHYLEGADYTDGHPHVYCLNCGQVLQHPNVNNAGTKHLYTHLKAQACLAKEVPVHEKPLRPLSPD
jgi:hypothetical protein